jgi:hypothetical protein
MIQVDWRLRNTVNVRFCVLLVRNPEKTFEMTGIVYLNTNGELWWLVYPRSDCNIAYRWLYALFLGIDANFCLKRKNVSNDAVDPDLNKGCAYFVEEKEYKKYLAEFKA